VELDIDLAAAERTAEAQRLIDTARADGIVSLGALGGMDLCILGGPMHSVFPEAVAKAWLGLGDRARQKLIDERTADMAKRGMLRPPPPGGYGYALAPALGLALAARCRPAFVVTASAGPQMRPLCFFALGDQIEPVRGLVIEVPAPPADSRTFPQHKKLGPLGWLYSYALVTPKKAAYMLAEHVSSPPSGVPAGPGQPPTWSPCTEPGPDFRKPMSCPSSVTEAPRGSPAPSPTASTTSHHFSKSCLASSPRAPPQPDPRGQS
jgi:hypothetical protein